MTQYRRSLTPGSTYFFTVNLADRRSGLLATHVDVLREAVGTAVWAYQVGDEPFEKQGHRMLQDALRRC